MSPDQIVHAWKDADYAASLPPHSAAALPASPVGAIELSDAALDMVGGEDARTEYLETLGCCQGFTQAGTCDVSAVGWPYCTFACFTIFFTNTKICGAT
jgi:mersacidin/lichenicidin family type 2 lantibiotic